MATAFIPRATLSKKDVGDLESPVMDAFWAVECAREMIDQEMSYVFGFLSKHETNQVHFSKDQAERMIFMVNLAKDKIETLRVEFYSVLEKV